MSMNRNYVPNAKNVAVLGTFVDIPEVNVFLCLTTAVYDSEHKRAH